MGEPGKKRVFWIDNFQGEVDKAYPFRSDLKGSVSIKFTKFFLSFIADS